MACSINKVKHLFWYMVLATVVVLIWSPQTMAKMVVASQHAPRDTREKRQLRSSSSTTKEINSGNEERAGPPEPENVIKAFSTVDAPVAEVDENAKSLFKLLEWSNSQRHLSLEGYLEAASVKLSQLVSENGREKVLSMLAAAKNNPATRDFAESLEITFKVQQWIDIKPKDDFVRMLLDENANLLDVLKSRLLKVWIILYPLRKDESPIEALYDELSKIYSDRVLAKDFLSAQSNSDAKDTAERLAEQQMKKWQDDTRSDDDVFKLLSLNALGSVFDNPLWNTWILYMKKLDSREHITEQELSEPILAVLRKNFKDRYLSKQFKAAESDEGKSRAKFFKAALLEAQQRRERAIKRQGIEDIATAPIKRQRNDDGQ
ncbi:hypothetical protein DD238_006914 [Peronospora effusa]|uniref:RxLR effector protein n=1 Tax=Peronospora effusa TaxID=542832 RepID=A0A3M6VCI8_9STRA|nr:hypothetical protein DD238_006914 [Peronospora effusa]